MLYGNESISAYTRSNITIWMAMAFQAGAINIGGFMACHRFVSHVTGFATFFGLELVQSDWTRALGMLFVPLFFLLGAMVSAQFVDIQLRSRRKPRYFLVFAILSLILFSVVIGGHNQLFGEFGQALEQSGDYLLLALLCLVCGMQNALVTTVSRSVIRTTHLTGITTDLGIGLARVLNRGKLARATDEDVHANLMRIGIIFFFGLGSVLGGLLFAQLGYLGFLLPAIISGALCSGMVYFQKIRVPK